MKYSLIGLATLMSVASCSGSHGCESSRSSIDITGRWSIENIVFSDSDYVRQSEVMDGSRCFITFDDESYFVQTDCNNISGSYTLSGDSIALADGAMTEMACENMIIEYAMRKIIPHITTVDVENDSVMRLNCWNEQGWYVVLRKTEKQ